MSAVGVDIKFSPYVNLFKHCGLDTWADVEKHGKVASQLDPALGKRIIVVNGTIPAVNYVKFPKQKSLNLSHRFCYCQVKMTAAALFTIHVEVTTQDGNTLRVSIGNVTKTEGPKVKSGLISFPLLEPPPGWGLLALDLEAVAAAAGGSAFKCLRSVQLCGTVTVRGVLTSDIKFSAKSLPNEVLFSHLLDAAQIPSLWLPAEPTDVVEPEPLRVGKRAVGRPKTPTNDCQPTAAADQLQAVASKGTPAAASAAGSGKAAGASSHRQTGTAAAKRRSTGEVTQAVTEEEPAVPALSPAHPSLELQHVHGYSGVLTGNVLYAEPSSEVVYTCGPLVVAMAAPPAEGLSAAAALAAAAGGGDASGAVLRPQGAQRVFLGHTRHVSALCLDEDATLLATAQEGKEGVVRLWDFATGKCLALLCDSVSHVVALAMAPDGKMLAAAGRDAHARQQLMLWDTSAVLQGGQATLVVKQTTDYDVRCLSFSPFENGHLMAAGHNSMRCYRLKDGELRGISIRMPAAKELRGTLAASTLSGPNIFTDIAYDTSAASAQLGLRNAYISSAGGAVFVVDYDRRAVCAAYQLHLGAINSISLGEGLAVTGSDDKTLRVWPLDFSSHLLEAEHEAAVTATAVGCGGARVVLGSEDGVLGLLDVVSRQYHTLLRSHCKEVLQVVASPTRPEYCTVSADHTIRVWDIHHHHQLYEFSSGGEAACCAAYHPDGQQLALGFSSGRVRLFHLPTTSQLLELSNHRDVVQHLSWSSSGRWLASVSRDQVLCVQDATRQYHVTHLLLAPQKRHLAAAGAVPGSNQCSSLALSEDEQYLASCSWDPKAGRHSLLVMGLAQLDVACSIPCSAPAVRLRFAACATQLWALDSAGALTAYAVPNGAPLLHLPALHQPGACTCFALLPPAPGSQQQVLVSGGSDQTIKLVTVEPAATDAAGGVGAAPSSTGGNAGEAAAQVRALLAVVQVEAYVGSPGTLTDVAACDGHIVSVTNEDAVLVWQQLQPPPPAPAAAPKVGAADESILQHQLRQPGAPAAVAAQPAPGPLQAGATISQRSWLVPVQGGAGAEQQQQQQEEVVMAGQGTWSTASWQTPGQDEAGLQSSTLFTMPLPLPAGASSTMSAPRHAAAAASRGGMYCSAILGVSPVNIPGAPPGNKEGAEAAAAAGAPGSPCGARSPRTGSPRSPRSPTRASGVTSSPGRVPLRVTPVTAPLAVTAPVLWLPSHGLLAYAADNQLVLQEAASGQQSYLTHHVQPITAVALSQDQLQIATATGTPEAGGICDVCVWGIRERRLQRVLRHHTTGVSHLSFSPDGVWLVSVAGASCCLWSLEQGEAVALGIATEGVSGIAWLPFKARPQFLTVGPGGLQLWTLQPTFLEQRQLVLPFSAGTSLTAVATAASSRVPLADLGAGDAAGQPQREEAARQEAASTAWVGDGAGGVWRVTLGDGRLQQCHAVAQLLPGECATALVWSMAAGALAVATTQGRVLRYVSAASAAGTSASTTSTLGSTGGRVTPGSPLKAWGQGSPPWQVTAELLLDQPAAGLQLETDACLEGVAVTGCATVWFLDLSAGQKSPVLCGHAAAITGLVQDPEVPGQLATLSTDGVLRIWQLRGQQAVPLVEFAAGTACCQAAFLPAGLEGPATGTSSSSSSKIVAGYADGCLRCYDVGACCVTWSSVRHPASIVALLAHPTQPLVMAASRDGLITVSSTNSGQLEAHCQDWTGGLTPLHDMAVAAADPGVAAVAWLDRVAVWAAPWAPAAAAVTATYNCPQIPEQLPEGITSRIAFPAHTSQHLLFSSPCLGPQVLLLDVATATPLQTFDHPSQYPITCLAAAGNGALWACGCESGGTCLVTADGSAMLQLLGPVRPVTAVGFLGSGEQLVCAAGRLLYVWSTRAEQGPAADLAATRWLS